MNNIRVLFLLSALMFPLRELRAEDGVQRSTAAARQSAAESPLMLNIIKDSYGSRVGLDYSVRWDFSDLKKMRPGLKTLYGGVMAIWNWDITENTRFKYYGFSTNPWRAIVAKKRVGSSAAASGSGESAIKSQGEVHQYKKRLRLSLSPLVDDMKRDLDQNLRNVLLESSLRSAPGWQQVGTADKKLFMKDVLSLDIWGIPGLSTTQQGLEYISK